jgi:hypothetical protein
MYASMDDQAPPTFMDRFKASWKQKSQQMQDATVIYPKLRWGGFVFLLLMYGLRVYIAQGWYIITYGLAIYLLNLFLGFLSPAQDPELEGSGPLLPVKDGEHMFIRRVPEFKFW